MIHLYRSKLYYLGPTDLIDNYRKVKNAIDNEQHHVGNFPLPLRKQRAQNTIKMFYSLEILQEYRNYTWGLNKRCKVLV